MQIKTTKAHVDVTPARSTTIRKTLIGVGERGSFPRGCGSVQALGKTAWSFLGELARAREGRPRANVTAYCPAVHSSREMGAAECPRIK